MNDDVTLLHRYCEEGSQPAFTELVRRHIDLVYGAALRRTGDPHRASEVAQQVFTQLARNAKKLVRHAVLAAWLHTATRNAALNLMISEQRRHVRESESLALNSTSDNAQPDWDQVRPALDAAIDELPETDRAAVVLRFLERRSFGEIGTALRVSEDAARMRTDRALDKLRIALARRGVTSTSAALALVVAGQPLLAAPAGLAATLAAHSLSLEGAGFVAATLVSFMHTKIITTAALSALIAYGAGVYFTSDREVAKAQPVTVMVDHTELVASLRRDNQELAATVTELNGDIAHLIQANAELVAKISAPPPAATKKKSPNIGGKVSEMQRAILNNLRQIEAARIQYQKEKGHAAASVYELVGVDRYIKTVRTVGGEAYDELSMINGQPLTVITPDGVSVTYDPLGVTTTKIETSPAVLRAQELGQRLQAPTMKAVEAYRAAHSGNNPPNEAAMLPYFSTAQEGADYVEFIDARKAAGM